MNISLAFTGCYMEHKLFFDAMATAMQAQGHRVGIITGDREKDPFSNKDLKAEMLAKIGFTPDFCHMWGATETIANGNLWKCQRLDQEDVYVHFDSDATELKKYTERWIIKVMDSGAKTKF